jgi:hypothetical protein
MRAPTLAIVLMFLALPVRAQDAPRPDECYPITAAGRVEVVSQSDPTRTGTLLCIGGHQVVLASEGRVETMPLDDVTRIVKRADSIADGFLKGAALAGVISLLCGECGNAGQRAAAILYYGALGAGLDALHGGRETIYQRSLAAGATPPAGLRWRLQF